MRTLEDYTGWQDKMHLIPSVSSGLGKPQKSKSTSGPTTKALTPPPFLELSGIPFFGIFLELRQKFFFFSGPAFSPPPS